MLLIVCHGWTSDRWNLSSFASSDSDAGSSSVCHPDFIYVGCKIPHSRAPLRLPLTLSLLKVRDLDTRQLSLTETNLKEGQQAEGGTQGLPEERTRALVVTLWHCYWSAEAFCAHSVVLGSGLNRQGWQAISVHKAMVSLTLCTF